MHWNAWGRVVTGMKFGLREKTTRFRCSYINWGFQWWCQQMHRQTMASPLCMHSGFLTGRSDQTIVMSWNDVTVIPHAILGGMYKRRAHTILRTLIWVSGTEQLGLLISHRPSTLAISVSLMEQSITRMNCVPCLSICMYPDLFGNFLVSMTLVVWP